MLKLSANLHFLFTELPFLDRIAATAKAGLAGVEFPYQDKIPPESIALAAKNAGVAIPLFNAPVNGTRGLCVAPEAMEGIYADVIATAMSAAEHFGTRLIHINAGVPEEDESESTLEERMIRRLRYAADEFSQRGLVVLLEPLNRFTVPGYFLHDMRQAIRLIEAVGRDNVMLQYDIFHAQRSQGDLTPFLRDHFDVIAHIQIADAPERHQPGTGEINYPFLFDELRRLDYQGWIGLEYIPVPDTERSLVWIREMGLC